MLLHPKFRLRTVRQKDLAPWLELDSDIVARGPYFPLILKTETSMRQRFEKDGFWSDESGVLLITEPESDQILGAVTYFQPTHYYQCYELGYILYRPEDRGKGIMTAAVRMFTQYLFDLKSFHRLQIQADVDNIASRTVAERCGYAYEGTMRGAIIVDGKPADLAMYGLLRSELPPRTRA